MFKNHKGLVIFEKGRNLFEESSPLDKDVEGSFRKNHRLSFRYQLDTSHSILSTKLPIVSTKPSRFFAQESKEFPSLPIQERDNLIR